MTVSSAITAMFFSKTCVMQETIIKLKAFIFGSSTGIAFPKDARFSVKIVFMYICVGENQDDKVCNHIS